MADLINFVKEITEHLVAGPGLDPDKNISLLLERGGALCNADAAFFMKMRHGEFDLVRSWNLPEKSFPPEILAYLTAGFEHGLSSGMLHTPLSPSEEFPYGYLAAGYIVDDGQVTGILGLVLKEESKACKTIDQALPLLVWLIGREDSIASLKSENGILRNSQREKDRFLSIVAHDLKSPFNGFLGLTYLLTDEFENLTRDDIAEISVTLRKSALNMYAMLENMLVYSRIQRNVLKFEPQEIRYFELVNNLLEGIARETESKRVVVINEIDPWMTVTADQSMITTILQNLISNAVKYSNTGGSVRIRVVRTDKNSVITSVSDHGVGIAEEIRLRLFDTGELVKSTGTAGESGSGLGLIIARELVEKHSGRLWLDSVSGTGTTVHFTIPQNLL